MIRTYYILTLLAWFVPFSYVGHLSAQDLQLEPEQASKILLLKNGNVLEGELNQQGKFFWVKMSGGQLRVPADQVDLVCKNLDDAYQQRRASRTASSADSHLELARWCMQHEMYENASKEIAEAQSIEPDNRRLPLLSRQLQQLIKLASYQAPAHTVQDGPTVTTEESTPVDQSQLDKAPTWARAIFVRQVQPLLVHSCATTGCHQSGTDGDAFQLNRLATDGAGHAELTLQNLCTTLSYIDWQEPEQSELLTRALNAHGQQGMKPLPQHKMQLLSLWVKQLAQVNMIQEKEPLLISEQDEQLAQALPQTNAVSPEAHVQPVKYEQRDPFDAEFFNQRYAERNKPVETKSQGESEVSATAPSPAAGSEAVPPPLATPGA